MIMVLTRRHLKIFFRDRMAVMFSVLGALILLGLYVLFLGKMQIDSLSAELPPEGREHVESFVLNWVFSGILVTSAITVPQAGMGILVDDRIHGRVKDFLVSPVKRNQLMISYILSAVIITMLILIFEIIVGVIGLGVMGYQLPSISGLFGLFFILLLLTLTFTAIAAFLVTLVKSQGGMSALSSLVGTLAGFLAGAYIPPLALPSMVVNVMNMLPFAPAAMLVRGQLADPVLHTIGFPAEVVTELQFGYGTRIELFDAEINAFLVVPLVLVWGILCGILAATRMKNSVL